GAQGHLVELGGVDLATVDQRGLELARFGLERVDLVREAAGHALATHRGVEVEVSAREVALAGLNGAGVEPGLELERLLELGLRGLGKLRCASSGREDLEDLADRGCLGASGIL